MTRSSPAATRATLRAAVSAACPSVAALLAALLGVAALVLPATARAERADRALPMNVEADALRYDDLRQTSIFTGRVVLTKGTIVIRGARVDVRQDADGFQYGVVTAEPGKRAFFRQKREGVDEFIEGEGETIEYDGKADRVKFLRRAEMRRFRGATLVDEVTGSVITYENTTDVFTVDGGPAASTPGGRVRAVLGPRESASAPAAQAARPAVPPAQLRTSPGLGAGAGPAGAPSATAGPAGAGGSR